MSTHQNERQGSAYSFIGEVSASSTHEINNELAVINEQSRLTAELLALGRLGHEVDPAELEHLVNRVIARVERADKLVQRMNAFAPQPGKGGRGLQPGRMPGADDRHVPAKGRDEKRVP